MNDNGVNRYEGKITVIVDSEVKSIIPEFIIEWKQDVNTMRHALDRGDYETIRNISHRMKGTGATCGFDALTDMGNDLLVSAGRMDTHAVKKLLATLAFYLEKVTVLYQ